MLIDCLVVFINESVHAVHIEYYYSHDWEQCYYHDCQERSSFAWCQFLKYVSCLSYRSFVYHFFQYNLYKKQASKITSIRIIPSLVAMVVSLRSKEVFSWSIRYCSCILLLLLYRISQSIFALESRYHLQYLKIHLFCFLQVLNCLLV